MSANGGMTVDQVKSEIKKINRSVNGEMSQSSPIYGGGHRTMAPTGRSSAGSDCESGFKKGPNQDKGTAHRY